MNQLRSEACGKSCAACSVPLDALWCVAPAPEDLLGGGGGVLHGGADRHLHVPVQKCLRTVQTDHGHVRGGVSWFLGQFYKSSCVSTCSLLTAFCLRECFCFSLCSSERSVSATWVWSGTTRWSCLHASYFLPPFCWLAFSSCTTLTQTSCLPLTWTMYLSGRHPGRKIWRLHHPPPPPTSPPKKIMPILTLMKYPKCYSYLHFLFLLVSSHDMSDYK